MELKKWIGVAEYIHIGARLGRENRAVEWELEGWGVGCSDFDFFSHFEV